MPADSREPLQKKKLHSSEVLTYLPALERARVVDARSTLAVAKGALVDVDTNRVPILHCLFSAFPAVAVVTGISRSEYDVMSNFLFIFNKLISQGMSHRVI